MNNPHAAEPGSKQLRKIFIMEQKTSEVSRKKIHYHYLNEANVVYNQQPTNMEIIDN